MITRSVSRQWRMLLIYNIYRIVSIFVLFGVVWFDEHVNFQFYVVILIGYFIFSMICLYLWYARAFDVELQVFGFGTLDIILMVWLINSIGYMESGLGVLLNATIAVLSILVPGRLAIFFAATASCMLLGLSLTDYAFGVRDNITTFFFTGIYGAGFFATSLTAWYLAQWVRINELLAQSRAKELASMQRINEYIVEHLHFGVIYVDSEMKIKVINSVAQRFFIEKSDTHDLTIKELSESLYQKYLLFIANKKQNNHGAQTQINNPPLQVHFFSASYAGKPSVLILLNDMLAIAQQAQQLKLASLGRFSASIAHELRNPLGAISHAAQLMGESDDLSTGDARLKQLIMNNCNRMNQVIKNVLQLSRGEQAKPQKIRLKSFLTQFKKDFTVVHACEIGLHFPKRIKAVVFDKSQLEQILVILCENAMQHGRSKDGKVKITLSVLEERQQVMLQVCDGGEGVPESIQNDIFEPFFTTVHSGTGMGLYIAKDLCEINQASLSLGKIEKGCCIIISFNQTNEIFL